MAETKPLLQQLLNLPEIAQGYWVAKRHGLAVLKGDGFSIDPERVISILRSEDPSHQHSPSRQDGRDKVLCLCFEARLALFWLKKTERHIFSLIPRATSGQRRHDAAFSKPVLKSARQAGTTVTTDEISSENEDNVLQIGQHISLSQTSKKKRRW